MEAIDTPKGTNYESEAYNSGWLDGYDSLVETLYDGYESALPKWLLSVIGGKKTVAKALKSRKASDSEEVADLILERIRTLA